MAHDDELTPKQRAQKRYAASEKGKEARRRAQKKYLSTKGRPRGECCMCLKTKQIHAKGVCNSCYRLLARRKKRMVRTNPQSASPYTGTSND